MPLDQALQQRKQELFLYLSDFLSQQWQKLSGVNAWGPDAVGRLADFGLAGKMMRGGLLMEAARMFGYEGEDALIAGSALELIQAALLAHDDIMDHDEQRRGKPSLWVQYRQEGGGRREEAGKFGEAMAMCVGDLSIFLAMELLGRITHNHSEVTTLFGQEIAAVCLGQMADVAFGQPDASPDEDEILSVYQQKTARYTFGLPLLAGAALAGRSTELQPSLRPLSYYLGMMFQIKDDDLGLFGDAQQTGKPIGSDLSEGKKTLFWYYLMQKSTPEQQHTLNTIFGSQHISAEQLQFVRQAVREQGVHVTITQKMAQLARDSQQLIANLPVHDSDKSLLIELVEYNTLRQK